MLNCTKKKYKINLFLNWSFESSRVLNRDRRIDIDAQTLKFVWEILTLDTIDNNIFDSSLKSRSKLDLDDSNDQFIYFFA